MEYFISQIILMPTYGHWEPQNFMKCDGRLLPISGYETVFALIGTQFGGDGRTNFALPKLDPVKDANGGEIYYYIAMEGIFPPRS